MFIKVLQNKKPSLSDQSAGSLRITKNISKIWDKYLLFPGGRKLFLQFVVAGESVNTALDENKSELGVFVFSVTLQMSADVDSLFDQMVQILRDLRSKTQLFQDSENLISGDGLYLRNPTGVTESDTNLGRSLSFLSHLCDLSLDKLWLDLTPARGISSVRQGRP